MKKLIVLIAVVIASASVVSAQNWSVGARLGSGFHAVGQYHLSDKNYIEARFGMSFENSFSGNIEGFHLYSWSPLSGDFSALYMWRTLTPNWTPKGTWFLDAGVGLNVGGGGYWYGTGFGAGHMTGVQGAYLGAQGAVKLGYTFEVPVSLSFDWSPSFGPSFHYGRDVIDNNGKKKTYVGFNALAIANFGITCTYNF